MDYNDSLLEACLDGLIHLNADFIHYYMTLKLPSRNIKSPVTLFLGESLRQVMKAIKVQTDHI